MIIVLFSFNCDIARHNALSSTAGMGCTDAYEDCSNVIKNIVQNIPDVVLMDIYMPHVNGIEGLQLKKKQFPDVNILMQTVFEDEKRYFQQFVQKLMDIS